MIGSIFIDIFKIACLEVAQFTHYDHDTARTI